MTIAKTMTAIDLKLTSPKGLTSEQRRAWNAYYEPRNAAFRAAVLEGRELVSWKYQRYMHDYLACVKAVDESVGRLLEFLDNERLAADTIVVYSADQGFYLGEHGWFDKRWIFEESLRTPLLVRWPGVVPPESSSSSLVSNIDFAETFLDAAGLPVLGEMQGRSLIPILRGETPGDWRSGFYYQYFEYPVPHHVRPHYGVVTNRYKLVHFDGPDLDEWELFDLIKDPHELHNVYGDRTYTAVVVELKGNLDRLRPSSRSRLSFLRPLMVMRIGREKSRRRRRRHRRGRGFTADLRIHLKTSGGSSVSHSSTSGSSFPDFLPSSGMKRAGTSETRPRQRSKVASVDMKRSKATPL